MAALPFCHVNLKSPKPDSRYSIQLQRLGDHIRKRRLDLGLFQRDLARRLGADAKTLLNWEKGRTEPRLRFLPAILAFLGEDPRPMPPTFGERLRRAREAKGLSIARLARQLEVDPTTVWSWEKGRHQPAKGLPERIAGLLHAGQADG